MRDPGRILVVDDVADNVEILQCVGEQLNWVMARKCHSGKTQ
jgi:hypothetical protein